MHTNRWQHYLAEITGTFFLVLVGTGAIIANDVYQQSVTHPGIAIAFGAIVAIMIYAVGHVSGAHFNPAVSLGFLITGKLSPGGFVAYVSSQILGAMLASALLFSIFPAHETLGATIPAVPTAFAFIMEVIITGLLMFVILSVTSQTFPHPGLAGLAIGGTVCLCALFAGGMTGASMNPARSIAPAVFSLQLDTLWLYLTAPFLGAASAVLLCTRVHGREQCCNGAC